jgi:hypothetical protein
MIDVSPNFAIGYYVIILLGYIIYKTINAPEKPGTGSDEIVSPLIGGIFIAAILIGEYMISIGMIKTVCGFEQWGFGAMVTFVPWVLIAGMIKFILMIRPGWLVPFSNTIGYFLASAIFGLTKSFEIIVPNNFTPDEGAGQAGTDVAKAIHEIYEDQSLLINQMTPDNLNSMITKFMAAGIFKNTSTGGIDENTYETCIKSITKAVYFKLFVSEFIWLLLAGVLVISITFNYIVNYGCKMNSEQLVKKQERMAAVSAAQADAARNGIATATVFSSRD